MSTNGTFEVAGWDKFQHYKKGRGMAWIKLHLCLLDDDEFEELPDVLQLQLIKIWLLRGRRQSPLPFDGYWIAKRIGCHARSVDLQTLLDKDFIRMVEPCYHDASIVLAQKRREENRVDMPKPAVRASSSSFDEFWEAYPKKVGKGDARKAWKQVSKDRPPVAEIIASLEGLRSAPEWSDPQFIPYPGKWLRRLGWEDSFGSGSPSGLKIDREGLAAFRRGGGA